MSLTMHISSTRDQTKSFDLSTIMARFKSVFAISCLVLLGACASKVTVVSNVPTPLVTKVPLNVSMSYTDEFKNHVYTESERKRALSSLNFADAQIEMFDSIFGGLTNLVDSADGTQDLIIEPEVLDFQYTAPSETKLKQYEIWIKYRIKLLNPDDTKLADWTIKGYGKTPTALLTSASKAFNSAANVALRDVGAQLATRFAGQRKIKDLVAKKVAKKQSTELVPNIESLSNFETAQIEETVAPVDAVASSEVVEAAELGATAVEPDVEEESSDE